MERQIEIFEAAHKRLIDHLLHEGLRIKDMVLINKKRYCIIFGIEKNLLITFKRNLFHTFGMKFINEHSYEEGDTINVEDLKKALSNNVEEIYTILPNGDTYMISTDEFLKKSFKWTNQKGKEVRSVSINEYKKVFEI